MAEPIRVRCEGSGAAGHDLTAGVSMCKMCGWSTYSDGNMPEHDRRDIIAEIERGDFDGP